MTDVICFPSYVTFGTVMDSINNAKLYFFENLNEIQLNGKTFLMERILNLSLTPFDYCKECTTKYIDLEGRLDYDGNTNYLNVFIQAFNLLNACLSFICNKYSTNTLCIK